MNMEIPQHIEVNDLAGRTGMSARFWKDLAKNKVVRGARLGNRVVIEIEGVNAYLEANRIMRLEQPDHLRRTQRRRLAIPGKKAA